jgi:adenosylcobinamide-phosphate synthase
MNNLELIIPVIAGVILDSFLGDPRWLPHPIRLFGYLIAKGERLLNRNSKRKLKGAVLALLLILVVWAGVLGLVHLAAFNSTVLTVFTAIGIFYGIANHGLISEALRVIRKLRSEGIDSGRKQLSMIVGRDTTNLSEHEIRTAVLETLAENLSDGVIVPLFFYFIGGIPLMFAYKMTNTLDSMIGYKSERFNDFGWFAAKFDDVVNFVPARITAYLMVLVSFSWRGFKFIFKYGNKHASLNAGYPEAALAGILNCRFGGPNVYHGKVLNKPYIGTNAREISNNDVYKACIVNSLCFIVFTIISIFFIRFK